MKDIVVIGAGPSGLCAAKAFLQYEPQGDIVVLESQSTLGGVWSKEQIYPTLKTNNLLGCIDFVDFPMDPSFGIKPGQHVTGEVMHEYLCKYAEKFRVADKIRFNTRVVEVRRGRGDSGSGWSVEIERGRGGGTEVLECRKVIVATGILSKPHIPALEDAGSFGGPIIHSSDLAFGAGKVLSDPNVQRVAVIGGGKSAYDAVYLAAKTGHKVEWIIRKSGRGPAWVFPAYTNIGPVKAWRERLTVRRISSFMSPWVWADLSGMGWLRRFFDTNPVGKRISKLFWFMIHHDTINDCGFESDRRLKILQPEKNPLWYGTQTGVLSFDTDFFDLIRDHQVKIHREDVARLSAQTIHLKDGSMIDVQAVVAATGFSSSPTISFAPTSLHSDLGLPTTCLTQKQKLFWAELDQEADALIGSNFPRLLDGPGRTSTSATEDPGNRGVNAEISYTPWRLYRGIAPPALTAQGDRSLVFVGMFSNTENTLRMEIQCLWALAYLAGKLDIAGDRGRVFKDTALLQRFAQHKAPYGHGKFYPDFVLDQVPYFDLLLNDLGLETRRKGGGLRELFEPYTQADYEGLVQEWIAKISI